MTTKKKTKLKWFWHIHHRILLEPLTEPIENRIKYIKEEKPKDEVELRLKLMKPVKGKLPKEFIEAWQRFIEAGQRFDEARQKYDEAGQRYDEAIKKHLPQLEALHKKECGCGWNGKTIFTKANRLKK